MSRCTYSHGPGNGGEDLGDAEEQDEEEEGGEDPQSDSHKHHPAVGREQPVGGAGNQSPVQQTQHLQHRGREAAGGEGQGTRTRTIRTIMN